MTSKKTILTVYIGRFSPFHNGHAEVLRRARQTSDIVLVLVGSINRARDPKNPWTFEERAQMIYDWVEKQPWIAKPKPDATVIVNGIRDFPYNDQRWIANVHNVIQQTLTTLKLSADDVEIRITGADRDSSTFYLKFFPEFSLDLAEENRAVSKFLTATSVREIFFGLSFNNNEISAEHAELLLKSFLPISTVDCLSNYEKQPHYQEMREEHVFNVQYREAYKNVPYEVIFHTVDACVIQTGYILLVRRRARPGKGLWALPGGFLNPRERLLDASIRELREETKIKVPEAVLRGSIKHQANFDYPDRSLRGRTVTTAFLYHLPDYEVDGKINLPIVKGSDDAEKAMWVPLDTALNSPEKFFEDHFDIIETLVGKL